MTRSSPGQPEHRLQRPVSAVRDFALDCPRQLHRHSRGERVRQIDAAQDAPWPASARGRPHRDSPVAGGPARVRLRPAIHAVRSDVSADRVRGGADGRVRTRPARARVPAAERAFTRECLRAAGAEEFAHQAVCRTLRGPEAARAHRPRPDDTRPTSWCSTNPPRAWTTRRRRRVLGFISQIRTERTITVLLVTHDFAAGAPARPARHLAA